MADQKQAIMQALMKAMGSSPSAPATSPRPKPRPRMGMGRAGASFMGEAGKTISDADRRRIMGMMGESGKTISDADRARAERMMGRIPPVGKGLGGGDMELSPEQIKMLEQMIKQQNRTRDAAERKALSTPVYDEWRWCS